MDALARRRILSCDETLSFTTTLSNVLTKALLSIVSFNKFAFGQNSHFLPYAVSDLKPLSSIEITSISS